MARNRLIMLVAIVCAAVVAFTVAMGTGGSNAPKRTRPPAAPQKSIMSFFNIDARLGEQRNAGGEGSDDMDLNVPTSTLIADEVQEAILSNN